MAAPRPLRGPVGARGARGPAEPAGRPRHGARSPGERRKPPRAGNARPRGSRADWCRAFPRSMRERSGRSRAATGFGTSRGRRHLRSRGGGRRAGGGWLARACWGKAAGRVDARPAPIAARTHEAVLAMARRSARGFPPVVPGRPEIRPTQLRMQPVLSPSPSCVRGPPRPRPPSPCPTSSCAESRDASARARVVKCGISTWFFVAKGLAPGRAQRPFAVQPRRAAATLCRPAAPRRRDRDRGSPNGHLHSSPPACPPCAAPPCDAERRSAPRRA